VVPVTGGHGMAEIGVTRVAPIPPSAGQGEARPVVEAGDADRLQVPAERATVVISSSNVCDGCTTRVRLRQLPTVCRRPGSK
jgi:hypothetical protein